MKKILYALLGVFLLTNCSIYRKYQRPAEEDLPLEGLFRYDNELPGDSAALMDDSLSLGDLSWQELFQDTLLQNLIRYGIDNSTDMQVALLRLDQAQARLGAARWAYAPSLNFVPSGTLGYVDGATSKTYEIPVQASWEIDLFGNLLNAKREAQAALLQQDAYRQAVCSSLVAQIAISYYTLLMLDEQVELNASTLERWEEQVRLLEARFRVGEENESALTSARAGMYNQEAVYNDLLRQQRETENALCTLLGLVPQPIERGKLSDQVMPEQLNIGIPLYLLSKRPDVLQAEMTLAAAYYSTNQARAAFYPKLTLSGSVGWSNALGGVVTNPGGWIMSAIASLAQPILNQGKLRSNLRVSKDEEEIAKLNYKQTLLDAGKEVNNALFAYSVAQRNREIHQQQCNESARTLHTLEVLYKTGNTTYLEWLTARQSLLDAQLNVATDRFQELQAVVNLYSALGGGTE